MMDAAPEVRPDLPPEAEAEIAALVARAARANGPVIRALNSVGGSLESRAGALPVKLRGALDAGMAGLLEGAYRAAGAVGAIPQVPAASDWTHRVVAAAGVPVSEVPPMLGSEDFGRFGHDRPAAMFLLGAGEDRPQLHNPDYDFPDDLIPVGAAVFLQAIREVLG